MPRISAGGGHPLHALTCRPTSTKRSDNRAAEKWHKKDGKVGSGEKGLSVRLPPSSEQDQGPTRSREGAWRGGGGGTGPQVFRNSDI